MAARGEVDATTLAALARAQVMRVPYENIDIYRGRPPGIEPLSCVERVIAGRGGYCYHLNGAFATLLEWLQVDVTRHVSGVQGHSADGPRLSGNHLGLTAGMPDGFGVVRGCRARGGPAEPLPLVFGSLRGGRVQATSCGPGAGRRRLAIRARARAVRSSGADFARAPAGTGGDFLEMHHELSTSPGAGFVRVAAIMRRTDGGVEILRGCEHSLVTAAVTTSSEVTSGG